MTTYEREIYAIINTSHDHLTVEQIFAQIREKYPKIVLATVYNNVNKLCIAGLIRRVSVEGMADRYDRIRKHDHLVCRRCGRLEDITFDDLTDSLRKMVGDPFLSYDLQVFYLCPDPVRSAALPTETTHPHSTHIAVPYAGGETPRPALEYTERIFL